MFTTFPEFKPLDMSHKDEYESYMRLYPPFSDLSFTTLMIWWNLAHDLEVSEIYGNLVLRYHLPSDPENSGLSLIGSHNMDQSIKTLLDHLKDKGDEVRLIHVPEFVINAIKEPDLFTIEEERDYAEYIYPVNRFYPLDAMKSRDRRCIKRFTEQFEGHTIQLRELDVKRPENVELLLATAKLWDEDSHNDPIHSEFQALQEGFTHNKGLGLYNRCLFIDDELKAYVIFQVSHDGHYLISNHLKGDRNVQHMFSYIEYMVGQAASEIGIPYINLEMDLGIPGLRVHKTINDPIDFFRKYRVTYAAKL